MNGKLRNMTALYITSGEKILLLYRQGGRVVNNVWVASAGGHFEERELNDAKSCVLRELQEELELTEHAFERIELRYVALRRTKGEIRQNYYFFAELKESSDLELKSNEGTLKWFDLSEIASLEMPYTAKFVLEHYLSVGHSNDKVYNGVANEQQVVFVEMPEF